MTASYSRLAHSIATSVVDRAQRALRRWDAGGPDDGAEDAVVKPFAARELLARVRTHLQLVLARRELTLELERQIDARTLELRQSEEKFRQLAATLHEVFWITDTQSRAILYISPAYTRIWGRSCESVYERPLSWFESVHLADRDRVERASLLTRTVGDTFDEEYRIVRADGSERWIHARAYPVRDAHGKIYRVAGAAEDITERKHAETVRDNLEWQLRQSQKLEALGTLTGGIAHDFNNLLAAMLGNAELLEHEPSVRHAPSALASVTEIRAAGLRAKELVQRLLSFARPQQRQSAQIELSAVLGEAVRLLRSTLPAIVELTYQSSTALPPVRADETLIHQIVMNLVTNAWHALGGRAGCIEIRLEGCRVDSTLQRAHSDLKPGPHVRLSVSDNGSGIAPENMEHIFEPFFTTKTLGTGTGLGLSVVHGIVRSLGGAIVVESERGRGTTFHVYLPASVAPHTAAEQRPDIQLARGQGELILFLDDEPELVRLAVVQLERLGYRAEGYALVADALAAFRADPQRYDLVITDYNMPQLSGIDVAEQLLRIRRDVVIALASGHMRRSEVERARACGIREIILKPFAFNDLSTLLRGLIGAESERQQPSAPDIRS